MKFAQFIRCFLIFAGTLALAQNPVPFVNQPLVPDAAVPGGQSFTLAVNGTGFVSGAVVNWNGSPRSTTFVSTSDLTAIILATDIAVAGTASITVSNPGSPASLPVLFAVTTPNSGAGFAFSAQDTPLVAAQTLITGDFNGDGKPDLITGEMDEEPDSYTVLLGNGDGTFTALPSVSLGTSEGLSFGVAIDLNGDGKLDVIGFDGAICIVLLGNGDGTFQPPETFLLTPTSDRFVAADFNRDGKNDLAVLTEGGISILLGKGDGTFQPPVQYALVNGSGDLAVGDMNGDGNLDLMSGAVLFLGNGDGTFQPGVSIAEDPGGYPVIADLNGDGKLDLVFTQNIGNDQSIAIYLGNGDGTFRQGNSYETLYTPYTIAVADLNGDGKLDVVGDGFWNCCQLFSVLIGNGDGTFQPSTDFFGFVPYLTPINGAYATNLPPVLADFNGDGRIDIAFLPGYDTFAQGVSVGLGTTMQIIPTLENFGNVNVGSSSSPAVLTATNVGSAGLTINSIVLGGASPTQFSIVSNTCGASLALNANCTVSVSCVPTATDLVYATLIFTDSAPASPQTIPLTCIGVGVTPIAQLSPTSLTFASQTFGTKSPAQTVTIANTGNTYLTFSALVVGVDPSDFSFTYSTSCFVYDMSEPEILPGTSCTFSVYFTPGGVGTRTAQLAVSSNSANSPQYISLTGTGSPGLGLGLPSGQSSSATVKAGTTANYTLSIGGGGLSGTATLACTGAPAGATCTVPDSENVSATTASMFTVSVSTTAPASAALRRRSPSFAWLWATFLIGMVWLPVGRRSRRLVRTTAAILSPLLVVFLASCGGGGGSGSGGTPAGNYTLTVKATIGSTTQSQTLKLIVQ